MNMDLIHDLKFGDLIESIKEVTNIFGVIPVLSYLKSNGKHSEYIRGTFYLKGDDKIDFVKKLISYLCPQDFVVVDSLDEEVVRARVFSESSKENKNEEVFCLVESEITNERISDLLIGAVESGIYYWCVKIRPNYNHDESSDIPYYANIYDENWSIKVFDEDENCHFLDKDSLKKGIKIMNKNYNQHYMNAIGDDYDAITADVFFQCCVFGETIYG